MYDAPPYEGIRETLGKLKESNVKLIVVTSKPQIYAVDVVDHVGLGDYFDRVVGPLEESKVSNKSFLIKRAIEEEGITDLANVVMVGDRRYDIEAANDVGVKSVGVTYGYGSYEELNNAGATYIADSPQDILSFVV
jgi:phosphoglycolate phosphatase